MGDKKGNLIVVRHHKDKEFDSYLFNDLHTGLITVIKSNPSYMSEKGLVVATGSYDRTIKVFHLPHTTKLNQSALKILFTLKHKFRIS